MTGPSHKDRDAVARRLARCRLLPNRKFLPWLQNWRDGSKRAVLKLRVK